MADVQKTIDIIFGAKDNTEGFKSIKDGVDSIGDAASSVTVPLEKIASTALSTETAIVSLGAAFLGFSVNEAGKFQASINEIGTLFNATKDQTGQLGDSIQTFAQGSTQSIEAINTSVYNAISSGTKWTEVTDLLAVAEKGAVAGATELSTATDGLNVVLNAYGLRSSDAAENTKAASDVMDAMFIAVQNGKTTMEELSVNIGKVASTAAAAKIPFPDLLAAIDALTVSGIKTDESITLINAAIKELLAPTNELSAALGSTNIATDGLQGVMSKLKDVTGGSADKMYGLFSSSEAAKAALILANDSAGVFSGTLEAMGTRAGKVEEAFNAMKDNLNLVTQNMENNFKLLLQNVGNELLPQWTDIIKALSDVFQGVNIGIDSGAFKPVFDALNLFGSEVENYLTTLAKNLPAALQKVDWTGFVDSFQGLGESIGGIFDGIDISTPQGLADAIQEVVDTIESLTRFVTGIVNSWGPAIDTIREMGKAFNEQSADAKTSEGSIAGVGQQFEYFKGIISGVASGVDLIGYSLATIAGTNIATGISAWITSLGGLGAIVANPAFAAFVALLVEAGAAYKLNADAVDDLKERQDNYLGTIVHLSETENKRKEALDAISERTGVAITDMDDFNKKVEDGVLVMDEISGKWIKAGDDVDQYGNKIDSTVMTQEEFNTAVEKVAKNLIDIESPAEKAAKGFNTMGEAQEYLNRYMGANNNVMISYRDGLYYVKEGLYDVSDAHDKASESTDKNAEAVGKLTEREKTAIENAQEVQLKLLELASDERIKSMEFKVELDTARIQGQVDMVKSAMDGLASFFESNADILSSFTQGILGSTSDKDKTFFKNQIEAQMDMQQQMINSQTELNSSITELNYAYARSLSQETFVRIDSSGLDRNLEAFMFEILKRIQTSIVGDRSAFLLGAGA